MKKIVFQLLILLVVSLNNNIYSQDSLEFSKPPPIPIENLIGHNRQYFQMIVNRIFQEKKQVGLLNMSSYAADYNNDIANNEFLTTTAIYHKIHKGISVNSGSTFNSKDGLKSFFGLQYMYTNKNVLIIYLPNYILDAHIVSNLALLEYKPKLNSKWSAYTRLQANYNYDFLNNNHHRSIIYSRLGLTYNRISFGIGANLDWYGSNKTFKENYGIFLKLNL